MRRRPENLRYTIKNPLMVILRKSTRITVTSLTAEAMETTAVAPTGVAIMGIMEMAAVGVGAVVTVAEEGEEVMGEAAAAAEGVDEAQLHVHL
ncbi:hypothetical protein A7C99_4610 [Trichophyton rubrum]|uniref:Uncharacterized protein n=1 Tax=Trichophyton rubrum TaxID=5551 RepID=A0A178EVJ5_TRIRU|nr:hypothetical protein A7C99_4610 [Trichophyton rubrum]